LSFALAAGAALRMGDKQLSRGFLEQASGVLSAQQERLEILLDAATDTDPAELLDVLGCLGESPEDLVTAANRVWDESRAAEFARLSRTAKGPEQPATEPLGITISFGISPVPGDEDLLLEWIPPKRRVLTWIGSDSFVERLGSSSSELTATDSSGLVDQLEELIAGGNMVDVAVGGVGDDECDTLLALLRKAMDPAGLVVLWNVDASGNPRTAPAAVGIADVDDELLSLSRLRSHGFMPETSAPPLVVAARPEWDEQSLAASRPGPFVGTVRVVSEQPIPDQLQLAYRASIPGHMAVEFDASDSPDRPDLVLVTDHTLMPDPAWIQALIDDHGQHNEPVGARVIDRNGDVVRAGLTADGRVIGLREEGSAPIMVSLRTRTRLGAPFVVAGDEDDIRPPVGRLLGSPVAVTFEDSAESGAGVGLREMFDTPVLLLGGPAPGREHPDETVILEKLFDRLAHRGITPVYQWAEQAIAPEPFALQRWRSKGVICFAPSSYFRKLGWFTPDPVQPRSDALVSALSPVAVAYLSPESLQFDFEAIAGRAGMARSFYTGVGDKLSERVDVKCTLAELADELCDSAEIEPLASPSKIPVIAPVDHKAGLVSIVIPVYNRWDLTEVCLESISTHTPQPYEIIVVDNGSTDQTSRGLRSSDASVIVNGTNLGFPMAVNQGIQAACGEYVCVLNNDTEVTDGWLEAMLEALAVSGTGMVGPRSNRIAGLQRVIDAPLLTDRTAAIRWAKEWKWGCEALNWRVNRLIGFCLVARRDLFERLGGFDEGFGIGNFEDDDLGRRVMDSGLTLRVADRSVVLHHGGATFTSAEMDYPALIHESARHLSDDVVPAGLAAALILSDSNPVAAASSAATVAQIADHVRIVERGAFASTELAAAALPGSAVTVVSADWTEDDGAAEAVENLGESVVLVLGSNEQVNLDGWGAARAEIESFGQESVEVIVGTSAEVRLVPTSAEAIAAVGSSSGVRAGTFRIT
jgi:GT2 family glycosyltransferase